MTPQTGTESAPTGPAQGQGGRGEPDGGGSPGQPPPGLGRGRRERPWLRAVGLFAVTIALAVFEPVTVVGVPFLLMVLALPSRGLGAPLWVAFTAFLVFGGLLVVDPVPEGLWYVERGWAILLGGWFVALTLRRPGSGLVGRALGAVAGAGSVAGLILAVRPGSWSLVDWLVEQRLRAGGMATLQWLPRVLQEEPQPEVVALLNGWVDVQALLFPALVGLASLAGLVLAWWLYLRLGQGVAHGVGPVRDFRFNDQLVWLLIGGVVLVVASPGEALTRTGSNTVAFMGALYALRGAAVVLFLGGGGSLFGAVFLLLLFLFAAPVIVVSAFAIGLGDTWLDLRGRARALMA